MSHPDGLPDAFLDRSLGRIKVPALLRDAGLRLTTLAIGFLGEAMHRRTELGVVLLITAVAFLAGTASYSSPVEVVPVSLLSAGFGLGTAILGHSPR